MKNLIVIVMFCSNIIYANDFIRIIDTAEPIEIEIAVNEEIEIVFDSQLEEVGTPGQIKNKVVIQSIDYRLWIKANSAFKPVRLLVKDKQGKIKVLVISSVYKTIKHLRKYKIISKKNNIVQKVQRQQSFKKHSYVDLVRFASQQLYAPKRLIKNIVGIVRTPVSKKKINLFTCDNNCNSIVSIPIASWRSDRYFITAVKLKNISNKIINLDPRALLGGWLSAVFQFNRIGVKDSSTDTTVVYLVSLQTFGQSL